MRVLIHRMHHENWSIFSLSFMRHKDGKDNDKKDEIDNNRNDEKYA